MSSSHGSSRRRRSSSSTSSGWGEEKPSGYHQAANASLFAPVIAIVAFVATTAGGSSQTPQIQHSMRLVMAYVSCGILLAGMICGIVALCGISKHGKRGLLGKGLVGIIIPLLLVALAVLPGILRAHAGTGAP